MAGSKVSTDCRTQGTHPVTVESGAQSREGHSTITRVEEQMGGDKLVAVLKKGQWA